MSTFGKVYLVGAGCGEYDLITLRGLNLLQRCDCVVYDSLIDERLLNAIPQGAEKISVGKRAGHHSMKQPEINRILVQKASEHQTVVRLKGGDPFVFGRGGEEILELQKNHIDFDVVPGISSSIAVPELAGIPVTHRELSRSFHVITGHLSDDSLPKDMEQYAKLSGTLVFLMGLSHLEQIAEQLIHFGKAKNTPTAVISNGASPMARVCKGTLENIAQKAQAEQMPAPAIIVVGDCVDLAMLSQTNRPLQQTTVSVTGTVSFTDRMSRRLADSGATVQRLDYLKIEEYENHTAFDEALRQIGQYAVVVLTSANGAEIFLRRLKTLKTDIRTLGGVRFAVIGSATARILEDFGIYPELMPNDYTSEALAELLCEQVSPQEKILILRAEKGSPILNQKLSDSGIPYDDIKTYDVHFDPQFANREITTDYVVFGSRSGVDGFFENGGMLNPKTTAVCIGDVTADAFRKYSDVRILPVHHQTTESITKAIIREVQP